MLDSLDPGFAPYALYFVATLRSHGIPAIIISGRRSQAGNYEAGGATRSLHLVGRAFDLQIYGYLRDDIPFWWWEQLGAFWEALGGRWGGRFRTPDVNHFDDGSGPVIAL